MDVFEFDYRSFPSLDENMVLCLGFFDGVHLGHQKIINEAKELGKKVGVLSFSNSAYNFLHGSTELLTPQYEKIRILKGLGVDYYFEIDDEGNPWYICPVVTAKIGLFGGYDVVGAVICDPISGDCDYKKVDSIPKWVDRVYDGEILNGVKHGK